eukprot:c9964_g1_i1.p1 GENE.c9964_g1_i1~~c9964_g1_i1.p1  ORF type:complete len:117 (+),score=4.84 c9964_g1_i1:2-352(+)
MGSAMSTEKNSPPAERTPTKEKNPQLPTKKQFDIPPCPDTDQALQTAWSFWFDKRVKGQSSTENQNVYMDNLKHVCSFNSAQSFWRHIDPWFRFLSHLTSLNRRFVLLCVTDIMFS